MGSDPALDQWILYDAFVGNAHICKVSVKQRFEEVTHSEKKRSQNGALEELFWKTAPLEKEERK